MFIAFIKKLFLALIILAVVYSFYYLAFRNKDAQPSMTISSFEECVQAGYPVMESYPRQCATPLGSFTEYISEDSTDQATLPINFENQND